MLNLFDKIQFTSKWNDPDKVRLGVVLEHNNIPYVHAIDNAGEPTEFTINGIENVQVIGKIPCYEGREAFYEFILNAFDRLDEKQLCEVVAQIPGFCFSCYDNESQGSVRFSLIPIEQPRVYTHIGVVTIGVDRTYSLYQDQHGQKYIKYNETGEMAPISKDDLWSYFTHNED